MKASLTFREEKSPLIRLKFPVNIAGFSLASGIAIGDNEDLSLHAGTPSGACPSLKLAYQPNLPSSSFSLTLKAGLSPWGPPRLAALSVSTELRFSRVSSGPFFTVHFKPQLGDFSFRKTINPLSINLAADAHKVIDECRSNTRSLSQRRRQSNDSFTDIVHMPKAPEDNNHSSMFDGTDAVNKGMIGSSHSIFDEAEGLTPRQLDKSSLYTPIPYRPAFQKIHTVTAPEHHLVDTWGNDYVKIDEFEHRSRRSYDANTDRTSQKSLDNVKDHQSGEKSPLSASVGRGSCLNEQETGGCCLNESGLAIKTGPRSVPWRLGFDESVRGWSLHALSTLPLGDQTTLKVRWGVNAHYDWMRGWESPLLSVKFPYLHLEKVSILTTASSIVPSGHGEFSKDQREYVARDEVHELSPVAALCGSTKRQLQLLYAENQVLKKAMEEIKSQFEQRSSGKARNIVGIIEDTLVEEQISTSKLPDHASELKESLQERKENRRKSQHDNSGTAADKTKRNHAHEGLDALKKLGGLGRGGGNGRHGSFLD